METEWQGVELLTIFPSPSLMCHCYIKKREAKLLLPNTYQHAKITAAWRLTVNGLSILLQFCLSGQNIIKIHCRLELGRGGNLKELEESGLLKLGNYVTDKSKTDKASESRKVIGGPSNLSKIDLPPTSITSEENGL